jgi:hypothetical protein
MKAFFEAIQFLFVEVLFVPMDLVKKFRINKLVGCKYYQLDIYLYLLLLDYDLLD